MIIMSLPEKISRATRPGRCDRERAKTVQFAYHFIGGSGRSPAHIDVFTLLEDDLVGAPIPWRPESACLREPVDRGRI